MKQSTKTNSIKSCIAGFAFFLLFFPSGVSATTVDSTETVYQEWIQIGEAPLAHIDFSARVVGCSGTNQVLLNIFNETPQSQVITFTIKVKNVADGAETTQLITTTMGIGAMNIAACGDSTYDNLKINIPSGYDPSTVQITISF